MKRKSQDELEEDSPALSFKRNNPKIPRIFFFTGKQILCAHKTFAKQQNAPIVAHPASFPTDYVWLNHSLRQPPTCAHGKRNPKKIWIHP